ncbi:NAD(P)H-dependent oxidoreductase [Hoyosella rhizosphaerae]|uniref:FMN reductase n=1 Tax=Hoyosella rhizosphaerae TaxID=1755582 RepID=A0A916XDZ6_9ACTN|nr:NAD(P)H-dependent oxidoreductase [Hoyosella rhizosphaerae]MBN4925909.1 NAD(P)H-dependent oxidoreductase [Hoyosella rhizosphaerae]GGC66994.1 FMN reductase [Hoyosella rhizosphaerae]
MTTTTIAVLVGSLRRGSLNHQLAQLAVDSAPTGVAVTIVDGLGEIPFYTEDLDSPDALPVAASALREAVGNADAVLLVTPEYNGTLPAVLKNAIDWTSRPFGEGAIKDKPVAVAGISAGQYGGKWAHDDALRSAGVAGARVVKDVTLSIGGAYQRFADGGPADDAELVTQISALIAELTSAVAVAA